MIASPGKRSQHKKTEIASQIHVLAMTGTTKYRHLSEWLPFLVDFALERKKGLDKARTIV